MAGNPKTPKSGKVSKQTVPGSKGVKVGANKGTIPSGNTTSSTATKMMYGGTSKKMMYGGTSKKMMYGGMTKKKK